MFKQFGEFVFTALFFAFLVYLVVFIIMGFPHPEWLKEVTNAPAVSISTPQ